MKLERNVGEDIDISLENLEGKYIKSIDLEETEIVLTYDDDVTKIRKDISSINKNVISGTLTSGFQLKLKLSENPNVYVPDIDLSALNNTQNKFVDSGELSPNKTKLKLKWNNGNYVSDIDVSALLNKTLSQDPELDNKILTFTWSNGDENTVNLSNLDNSINDVDHENNKIKIYQRNKINPDHWEIDLSEYIELPDQSSSTNNKYLMSNGASPNVPSWENIESKFIVSGTLLTNNHLQLTYNDNQHIANNIDLSSLKELPTILNSHVSKFLRVVSASGGGETLEWQSADEYSFSDNRNVAQLQVTRNIQNTSTPYASSFVTNTYNFLPALVNSKILSVTNNSLVWIDESDTKVSNFSINAQHQLVLSQNDNSVPKSVNLAPYLNTVVTSGALNSAKTHIDLVRTSPLANVSVDIRPILVSSGVIDGSNMVFKYSDYHPTNNNISKFNVNISSLQNQNKLPTTTDADKFAVSTTTANNWVISDKISLNPVRFGDQTTSNQNAFSTLIGYSAGNFTNSSKIITCLGYKAGESGNLGDGSTCIGYRALDNSSGTGRNTALGHLAGHNFSGVDSFLLGESAGDGGSGSGICIGRYSGRGAIMNGQGCILLGKNVLGTGYGQHLQNVSTRTRTDAFLVGHNIQAGNTSPYLLDGTMGLTDSVRKFKICADEIHVGSSLPQSNSTSSTQIWNDQGVLRYGSGSALAYTDTVFSLPPQANEPDGLLATNGSNVFWSAPSLSVQSTGATIGRSNTVAKTLSFESNVTTGVLGRINAFKGGNLSSSIMFHGGTNNLYDTMEIRVQQGTSGSNPITAMYIGAQTTGEPLVSVFGDFRSILDCTIGKEDTLGTRKINFRTGTNALNIAEINVFGRDNNATEAQYSQDEYKIGQNTTGSLYGFSRHLRKYNNVLLQMLRVGKDIQTTDSYVEAFSSLKIVGASDHRLILGDFTAPYCAGRIDINLNSNTGLIGETNYRALDSNNAQVLYGQTFCSLSTNNPIYGTYYIKVAQGAAIGTPYLARFGRTSATANNEDIHFNGIVTIDTLRFSDATTMTTAPLIKNTLSSAPQNGNEIYNAFYINTIRGIDTALINTKLNSTYVKNVLQTTALFAGLEVYNCWYHDTARQLDMQVTNTKLSSTYVKNVLQTTALFAGLEVYNCWYHDTARQLDMQVTNTKLNKSHVQTTYQGSPNSNDIYNCNYINDFLGSSGGTSIIKMTSSNNTNNSLQGTIEAKNGSDMYSLIAHSVGDASIKQGVIGMYSYSTSRPNNSTHPTLTVKDDEVMIVKLKTTENIFQDSSNITSNIINRCPGNPNILLDSSTSNNSAVISNIKTRALINSTYEDYSDIKTSKLGDFGWIDFAVQQNNSYSALVRIGKAQITDNNSILFQANTLCAGIFTTGNIKLSGVSSGLEFNSGSTQTEAVLPPTTLQEGYRLTANSSGGWTWESPDVFYDATDRNINIGPINSSLGVDSIGIGYYAGQLHTSRSRERSIFVGTRSGQNTIPETNATDAAKAFDNAVCVGYQSGMNSTFMENCVCVGSEAGGSVENIPHSNSCYIGYYSGHDSGNGSTGGNSYSNNAMGTYSMKNYVGIESNAIGRDALYTYQKVTSQRSGNNAMGSTAMRNMVGSWNCSQGSASMRWDSGGTVVLNHNVALGADCMGRLTNSACANSNDNCFIGSQSARILSGNAVGNVGIGKSSFYQGVGSKNVMLGFQSGYQHNGSNCIYIGQNQGYQQTESNKLKIGTYQNQQIISGTMGSTDATSELSLNAKRIDLPSSLPTAYDSTKPNQIYIKNGQLRIGVDKDFYIKVSGQSTQTFGRSWTTYIFPTVDTDQLNVDGLSVWTSVGHVVIQHDGLYFVSGTMRVKDTITPENTNFAVAIHTSNNDGSHTVWDAVLDTTNSYDRTTVSYSKIVRFTQDQGVRTIVYFDHGTAQQMQMAEMVVYRLGD